MPPIRPKIFIIIIPSLSDWGEQGQLTPCILKGDSAPTL
ncbi:hypothetical protein YPIP275_1921 [Yersinia pestis biovar Orientalis str. IP275]|uniref:Uncharacterized protein n=1 Tax=Yersinia pestis biovar Orientalis str. IP275 TaxID=373665 RepID=A0AAV3BCZ2_YERPE|nr:hypothetical protein YPIP275_1921 [Yersinia pestis biovar Orientalis str. IP275]